MSEVRALGEVSTDSWVRMLWLTCVRGYRVPHMVERPREGAWGSIHYITHWWLAQ